MPIGLTEEHRDLRDSVHGLITREVTSDVVRAAVDAATEKSPPFWSVVADHGLLGLHIPEHLGGAGYGILELAVVLEELGRGMVPGPLLPTTLASAVLASAGHTGHFPGLAEGSTVGAVGLSPATLRGSPRDSGELVITGAAEPVLGAHLADVLLLPVRCDEHLRWVVIRGDEVDITELTSHDPTRRLARVRVDNHTVAAEDVLPVDSRLPWDLAATLFAAESSGLAGWASSTAAEYAKVRHQFGRPIGQFQGVKHRCARMLARAEQATVCAWDAARARDGAEADEAALAAAVAGATSVEAAFDNAKDCVQTLGGIGFTWEHDAGLFLRRAQTMRLLLGPTTEWQRTVATLMLGGVRRQLGVDLPPEAERVRERVRAELVPARALDSAEQRAYLAERGYSAPHLPKPWGRGADAVEQLVISQELRDAEIRTPDMVIGNWVVPTLIAHGTAQQQDQFLPRTLRGDLVWCQLFSEPGAGSDLAALSTKATKVDGGWKVTGQKVWTSVARQADWAILLARTDQDAPKHRGISYFLLDMSSPGIDIRPLTELTGDALFNEVFLDDVFVPDDAMVGEPGQGWKLARTTLANERVSLSRASAIDTADEELLHIASAPDHRDTARLTRLGALLCDAQSGGLFGLRGTINSLAGGQPGAESSIGKLIGVEHEQQAWETAMDWLGPDALTGRNTVAWRFLNTRCLSIAGGTTDVQLNIIGERLLGLPRDPEPPGPG